MSIQIKYAYRRHNTRTYRRTYPQHLRDILGPSLKQSLKTSDGLCCINGLMGFTVWIQRDS